jgi:hypothetical protein
MKHLFRILILVCATAVGSYAQAKKPIVASDLMKIVTTNQLQLSPDGSKAVMVVNRKGMKGDNEYYYTRHLYRPFSSPLATRMTDHRSGRRTESRLPSPAPTASGHRCGFFR